MTTTFTLQDIIQRTYNDHFGCVRTMQLEESAHHLKLFMQQHDLQNQNFESFQDNLQSLYIPKIKQNITKNKSKNSNTTTILIGVCALIEVALIRNNTFYAIGIHFCGNTFNSNVFSSQQRIKCMSYIQREMSNIDELQGDLESYDPQNNGCGIIDELEVNKTEAPKWISELNLARQKASKNQVFQPLKDQESRPNISVDYHLYEIKDDTKEDDYKTPQHVPLTGTHSGIYRDRRNEKHIRHYTKDECQLILDAMIIVMTDPHVSHDNDTMRVRGMKESETDKFKKNAINLMHVSSPNLLPVICDCMAITQLNYFRRHSQLDQKLNICMKDFLVNKRGIKIMNMQPLHQQGTIMKRMMNYIPFVAALYSQTKLKESPKPMQLIVALMMYRAETEIINAYKFIDYNEEAIKCIDTVCVYLPKMMDIIYQQLKSDKKNKVIQIMDKDYHDPDYRKTETFYKRVFGELASFITKNAQEKKDNKKQNKKTRKRFLLRIFVLLGREQANKGFLTNYPRYIYSLQVMDEQIKSRINNNVYKMLVNIKNPIHIYPIQLAINRYQSDALMLVKELRNILHPEMKESYDDKLSTEDRVFVHLMETHYTMFTTIIYPQKYQNGELFFTRKMYNLRATGIFRFRGEDIMKILPKYFEENKFANYLERVELDNIKSDHDGRDEKLKYFMDKEFDEFQQEFQQFNKGSNLVNNPMISNRNESSSDDDDDDAVIYDDDDDEQPDLRYDGSIVHDFMDKQEHGK